MKKISKMFIGLLAISSLFACGKKTDTKNTTTTTQTTTEETKYKLELTKNIADAGTVTGENTYKEGAQVTIGANANTGYSFLGWYNGEQELTKEATYSLTMPSNNLKYEAKFSVNKYTITIDNQVAGVTIDGITSGEEYDYNSVIDLTTTNVAKGTTIKWTRSDNVSFVGNNYSFNVPAEDITITLTSLPYEIDGNNIKLGYYPQTKVNDNSIIEQLNNLAGTLPTKTNDYSWTNYGYYSASETYNYMWYIDIDYDNDGIFDYRGVYFDHYRPTTISFDYYDYNSEQDDNGYTRNKVYWFKYEVIEWNILNTYDGETLLISNLIVDSQNFSVSDNDYYNNSSIRNFLVNDFYNTAFYTLEKAIMKELNSSDKVSLLRSNEVEIYANTLNKTSIGSDYAKAQGLRVSSQSTSNWILKELPSSKYVYAINYSGELVDNIMKRTSCYGIRPVIVIVD